MDKKKLMSLAAAAVGVTGLALIAALRVSLSQAAPPPRRRPRPRPPIVVKPPRRIVKVPPKRLVVPRRRRLVVHRAGARVIIRHAGKVIRPGRKPVIVNSITALRPVPTMSVTAIKGATAYKVARVPGHTPVLMMGGKETAVRLLGVDPALPAGAKTAEKAQADCFLQNLLAGEWVYLDYDSDLAEKDEAGTPVGYLRRAPDGMLVNLEVIRQGYALAATEYPYEHKDLFTFYEGKAQGDAKGIWGSAAVTEGEQPATR